MLAIQRSVAVESGEGTRDGLRLSGIDPAGVFLGKASAVGLQLLALQVVLWAGVTFLFDVRVHPSGWPWWPACSPRSDWPRRRALRRTLGRPRVRDTLLPLLVLPVLAPVLLAGSKVWEAALGGSVSSGEQWLEILVPFAASTSCSASSCTARSRRRHDP